VVIGAALVVLGVRKWLGRPRAGDDVKVPGWMASLETATAARSATLALLLSAANPKNMVLTASAVAAVVETGAHGGDKVVAAIVFVLLGSSTVVAAVLAHRFGGERARPGSTACGGSWSPTRP
jgi:threonine/homoserine/homoserine lactone efflux protein